MVTMSVALRSVTENDYELYRVCFVEIDKSNEPMSKEFWTKLHLDSAQVITYDYKDVGYIWSVLIHKLCYVFELAVNSEYRGKGIGKRAFELLKEHARRQGCNSIALHCEESKEVAIELYVRAGLLFIQNMYHVKINLEKLESLSTNNLACTPFIAQPTWLQTDWDHVEQKYPMIDGMLKALAGYAYVPIKMTRSDEICGFCILGTEDNMLWRLAVDRNEDATPFMVAVSRMFTTRTEYIPLWLEKNRSFVDYILENVPSAEEFETYIYMVGEL